MDDGWMEAKAIAMHHARVPVGLAIGWWLGWFVCLFAQQRATRVLKPNRAQMFARRARTAGAFLCRCALVCPPHMWPG